MHFLIREGIDYTVPVAMEIVRKKIIELI
jgi:hypothetical protein